MQNATDHPFFKRLDIEALTTVNFDARLAQFADRLTGVFFWGHDCPNCEVAKAVLSDKAESLKAQGLKWFHVNVYDHADLGVRFGLHGIPTFIFFRAGKKLGKISPFPGYAPFIEALQKLQED